MAQVDRSTLEQSLGRTVARLSAWSRARPSTVRSVATCASALAVPVLCALTRAPVVAVAAASITVGVFALAFAHARTVAWSDRHPLLQLLLLAPMSFVTVALAAPAVPLSTAGAAAAAITAGALALEGLRRHVLRRRSDFGCARWMPAAAPDARPSVQLAPPALDLGAGPAAEHRMLLARRAARSRTDRFAAARRAGRRPRRMAAAVELWRDHGMLTDQEHPLLVSDLHAGDGRLSRVLRDAVCYSVDFRGYDAEPLAADIEHVDLLGTLPPGVDVAFLLGGLEELPIRCDLGDRLAWHARWLVTSYVPPAVGPDVVARREAHGWRRHQSADGLAQELGSAGFSLVAGHELDGGELLAVWRQGTH